MISPQDVLDSHAMRDLLSQARNDYDFVIIDTPPANVVSESRLMAAASDRVVMVVKWESTARNLVKQAVKSLESAGAKFAGVLLNQADREKMTGYGYGYAGYSKDYNSYYGST